MRAALRFTRLVFWVEQDRFGKFIVIYSIGFFAYATVCITTSHLMWLPALWLSMALTAASLVRLVVQTVRLRRADRREMEYLDRRLEELTNVIVLKRRQQQEKDDL